MAKYKIPGICGSLRKQSFNLYALQAAGLLMPSTMELTGITTLAGLPMYNPDLEELGFPDPVCELRDLVVNADGLLFSAAEYNWTMSASLKNGIDWISRFKNPSVPFHNKPCAILSATTGPLGGARVQYDVRKAVTSLGGMFLVKPEVFIGMAAQKFDSSGSLVDAVTAQFISAQMTEFNTWIGRVSL